MFQNKMRGSRVEEPWPASSRQYSFDIALMSDKPLLLNILLCRDFGFTWDACLTETAAISIKGIVRRHIPFCDREVLGA